MKDLKFLVVKLVAFVLLLILTFGAAIYGINNTPTNNVRFKGKEYKKTSLNTFVNSKNHHILVSMNEGITTISIDDDDVIIIIVDHKTFSINKNDQVYNGDLDGEPEKDHALKDYIELVYSYHNYEMFMDEFPEVLIFPFFALIPFIFGLILLVDIFKKRVNKITILNLIFRGIIFILFISSLALHYFVIYRNI